MICQWLVVGTCGKGNIWVGQLEDYLGWINDSGCTIEFVDESDVEGKEILIYRNFL